MRCSKCKKDFKENLVCVVCPACMIEMEIREEMGDGR